ncbi:Germin-like protein subfamily 3 member 2 [Capsicum baccatum]|uniref:Germin-like protein subfamily 3 member 2 n=1 Tax=Capsicum baccatum TaxID=33114 RepID=A0A2G2WB32_CAPBA|nr:Germin-like protein subfamily 3 member 2 [Capsicum baccatum]
MTTVLDEAKNYFIDNVNNFQVKFLGEERVNTALIEAAAICSPWDILIGDRFIKRRLAKRTYDRGLGIALKAYAELEEFTSIFLSCKHSSLVTVDDFVYSGTKDPGNFKHSGFSSIPVSSTIFPRLNTLGMSFVHADFDVDGVNVPHFHPRATETALVLKGKIYSGFVDSGNRVFAKVNAITKYSLTSSENCASMSFPSSAV